MTAVTILYSSTMLLSAKHEKHFLLQRCPDCICAVCFTVTFLPVKAETRLKITILFEIVFSLSHMYSDSMV